MGEILLFAGVLCVSMGCSKSEAEPGGLETEEAKAPLEGSLTYAEERMTADDSRARIRGTLQELGQGERIPEDATLEELQALLDEKVDKGLIPKERAKRMLKVLQSADAHNERLERLDQQLFGENAY